MADLEPNDRLQDRGVIKVTDGSQVLELDSSGNIVESNLTDAAVFNGGQKYIFVSDINELFYEILVELKIANAHLEIVSSEKITRKDIKT